MRILFPLLAAILLFSASRLKAQSGTITLHFRFEFHGQPMEPGKIFITDAGDSIQLDQVRFYLGEPYAIAVDGRPPEINSMSNFWLIDSKDTASLRVTLPVEAGLSFSGVGFHIGVDSMNQVRGARSGALDPLKGMYWTWNSGYVAVKIEGHSASATSTGKELEYHLGGYRKPYSVRTIITLKSLTPFTLAKDAVVDLSVPVELDRFFPDTFSIKRMPTMMTPGPMAKRLMNQFKDCFLRIVLLKPAG